MKKIILSIEGMTCSACSDGLEKYLKKQEGITKAVVNLVLANASIEYNEKILTLQKVEEFIKQAGFKSLGEFKEIKIEKKNKQEKRIFIFSSFLLLLLMYISMGHMIHLPIISFLNPHTHTISYTACLLILTIYFMFYGLDILKNGYKNLIHKTPNMDTLVALGVITSFLYSFYNTYLVWQGNHNLVMNLYFESSATIIYFVKLGRYMDRINKDKTKEAIQKLVEITPSTATIKRNDTEEVITLDRIHKGDILISRAGEKIAVDGEIIFGNAHFDESFITGESKPVAKQVGDMILAGSLNYDGYLEYRAEKIGKESTVSEIVKLVVEASNTKAPIAKIADTVASYFVPIVMIIALLTFCFYVIGGYELQEALTTFVTILVVACPCSLGLATPLAIIVSEGLCVQNGILVKKSEILENAQKVNSIVFDKTGTLTYGKLKIAEILNYSTLTQEKLLQLIGSIENQSTHPIAKAFTDYLAENKITPLQVENFENITGLGIVGTIHNEKIILGNAKILDNYNIKNPYSEEEQKLTQNGNSIVYAIKNEEIIALIGVNDIIRDRIKDVIETLSKSKIDTTMLTGDNEQTAEKIAKEIGITNVIANVLPTEKANVIKELKANNKFVMMCGDGINDSPALASSDIGVSIHSGTDIAMDSSDVILTKNDLNCILTLLDISKKTVKNIKQNLFWAFFYNCLMIPIAIGVFKPFGIAINPMIASLAMVLSSLTVILNTLRLKK